MNIINFEGLGLRFNINNVLIDIFGIKIYWYSFLIVIGIVISLILCKNDDNKYSIKFDDILLLFLFLLPISIICARIFYILFKLDYYTQNPLEMFNIRNGGLAIYGGIIGAIFTIIIFCKIRKIKILNILDYLAPYLAIRSMYWKMGKLL